MAIDLTRLDALMSRMRELGITELEYAKDGERIHLVRDAPVPGPAAPAAPTDLAGVPAYEPPSPPAAAMTIAASMHGLFYTAPAPDAPPFVTPGDIVDEGQPLYILEVMKTLSRMEAEFRCRIIAVLCGNAQAVEPGTPLFSVERLDA
ncbi:acetyl-CoA carboxylase biotin carboxyl carrier protein subunit [Gluconacetobacter azotocaptans]|uniref:Biotin carboxyl carrier protein of acetyl-CoA carboxylase n=1 Tax=Gluconacetobacter azotocaptans TaxID=142834 RepID=A0A7W4PGR8_9PROT|nr:biotin/lipoyl-containing protein [Gluconacetobacter azotocaptans]MBB2190276.1 acetyl-CoA carboxylase biotin carboxyl carrier protein subunit [Gluconacetobacter azotocaptans]MBM9400691.1 acetyl-CoA carboxylase biotin carboxyl carrier protein subunit [Gluconacetobacter azotocaptans]GBQ27361.1 biotin carboxyl carrier protein of acetyl-CoA carboxylase [Gluconacetobacter azotocaptans DSM 13594]